MDIYDKETLQVVETLSMLVEIENIMYTHIVSVYTFFDCTDQSFIIILLFMSAELFAK